jgi:hypothetical protein
MRIPYHSALARMRSQSLAHDRYPKAMMARSWRRPKTSAVI